MLTVSVAPPYLPCVSSLVVLTVAVAHSYLPLVSSVAFSLCLLYILVVQMSIALVFVLGVAVAPPYLPHVSSLVVLTVSVAPPYLPHASSLVVLTVSVVPPYLPHVSSLVVLTVAVAPPYLPHVSSLVVLTAPSSDSVVMSQVIAMQQKPQLVLYKSTYVSSFHHILTVVVVPSVSSLVVLTVAVSHSCRLCVSRPVVLSCLVASSYLPCVSFLVVPIVPVVVVHIFVLVIFQQTPIEVEVAVEDIHLADVIVGGDEGMTDHTHKDRPLVLGDIHRKDVSLGHQVPPPSHTHLYYIAPSVLTPCLLFPCPAMKYTHSCYNKDMAVH